MARQDDSITASIAIAAPIERVWNALIDHRLFGQWFRVDLEGPFAVGQQTVGAITYPGHEGAPWRSVTEVIDEPRRLVFRWPHGDDEDGREPDWTVVAFDLAPIRAGGTRVTVTETGFAALPEGSRETTMRRNAEGWEIQTRNLRRHVEGGTGG
ncbi:vanillate O-demethylase oxidoreductase VanB [Paracoccus sp. S-4012]|uniref:SRPBCC family protein n=1 Tax=Paracoccus sp. S-4012 TaxID=2665648 RepID=UPI0012B01D66|nr:SRPBCC family protein [Paracoccus sp. S-4012]MRX50132.1 vanillate O-demethylase oxidoreductase VanB [Paracoccus sp. S-4012]